MDKETVLSLVKSRIGITAKARDEYIKAIINGVEDELKEVQGLSVDLDSPHILMFVVDYATWRYQNRDSHDGMPRHLQFRLHNLVISSVKKNDE